jgi:solute carrier family 13 (sodium-dependent dicarboxylate transporter), member 2/3/5
VIRTVHQAITAVETYSPAEEQFNRRRRTFGLFLAPVVLVALLALPISGLSPQAHRMAAIMVMVIVLWVSEALPMAVTAVLGPMLAVIFGVAPARAALAGFADPIIFLFIGSFMLAEAMFVHGVDRRIAFTALSWRIVGTSGSRILVMYGGVATCISMWISNTATTAMMFPIGLSIVSHLARHGNGNDEAMRKFALAMMLITSFGASVGGMATPVGTPPNLIGIGMIERLTHVHIDFFQWMLIGMPIVIVLFAFLALYFYVTCVRGLSVGEGSAELVRAELKKLGPLSAGQRNVLIAFGTTILLWTLPGFLSIAGLERTSFVQWYQVSVPEGVAAMLGAILLFLLPISWRQRRFTLTWDEAMRIDWGIVLLYGGGLAMGDLAFSTGLAKWVGQSLTSVLPSHSVFTLSALFAGLAILLSEATSNTASANMIVPVAMAVSQSSGVSPILPALAATLGASMGFMMPISTAPNAIVYSSGYVPITQMMRFGIALDIVGFLVIVAFVTLVGPLLW